MQYASKYLVGRPFRTHMGQHHPGELAPKEASTWNNLDAMVAAGHLFPYVPEDGYKHLPPHVFNAVRTRQESMGIIQRGDAPVAAEWDEPEVLKRAREMDEAELATRKRNEEEKRERIVELDKDGQFFSTSATEARPVIGSIEPPAHFTDSKRDEAAAAADEDFESYEDGWTKSTLLAEIDKRNAGRDEKDKISREGNKPDLSERLRNDDMENDSSVVTDDDDTAVDDNDDPTDVTPADEQGNPKD